MPLFFHHRHRCRCASLSVRRRSMPGRLTCAIRTTAQVQTTSQQATVYATMDDCVRAMAQQNLPASNCQQR